MGGGEGGGADKSQVEKIQENIFSSSRSAPPMPVPYVFEQFACSSQRLSLPNTKSVHPATPLYCKPDWAWEVQNTEMVGSSSLKHMQRGACLRAFASRSASDFCGDVRSRAATVCIHLPAASLYSSPTELFRFRACGPRARTFRSRAFTRRRSPLTVSL